jgi:hypothetical protein
MIPEEGLRCTKSEIVVEGEESARKKVEKTEG